jgi:hypothetical protein
MLLHFSKGSTTSPASQMQQDLKSSQSSRNPVAVFRQVYRNTDGKAATVNERAHERPGAILHMAGRSPASESSCAQWLLSLGRVVNLSGVGRRGETCQQQQSKAATLAETAACKRSAAH